MGSLGGTPSTSPDDKAVQVLDDISQVVDSKKGIQGVRGKQGDKGAPGKRGEQGNQGGLGDKGDPGFTGDKGERGFPGKDSIIDYDLIEKIIRASINDIYAKPQLKKKKWYRRFF